jgi:hypothetical protein
MMVVLTSVFGKQLRQQKHDKPNQSKQKQAAQKQQPANQSIVSELSLEVVVPSHAFDFNQNSLILPVPQITYLTTEKKTKIFTRSAFLLSYLENIYEHFIAPNAP